MTLEAALNYAAAGLPVFPCRPDKRPYTKNGFKDATTDQSVIEQWWKKWPDALISIPTGAASGLAVLDLDVKKGKNGFAFVPDWESRSPVIARTISGGAHLYFKAEGAPHCTSDDIALGVDTRGEGGYVVVPPSAGYTWVNGSDFSALPIWPDDMRPKKKTRNKNDNGDGGAANLLAADLGLVVKAMAAIPNNDLGYDEWKRGGLAIWGASGGSDEGFAAFDRWSQKSKKYDEAGTQEAWAGITNSPPDRIGAEAILKAADFASPIWREVTIEQREVIESLAALSALQYDQQRKEVAKTLDVRVDTLDQYVFKVRPRSDDVVKGQGTPLNIEPTEPWSEPVDGERLVADMEAAIKRHVVLSDEQALGSSLYAIHTHAFEFADHSPRLHIFSPAPRCGKTTLLDIVADLVAKPLRTENVSLSAMFRIIEMAQPTLLFDEVDAFLNDNEDMRGILNSGHRRGVQYVRTVGEDFEPRGFSVWAPVAIAGIGKLAQSIEERSITISLRRRLKDEKIERLKRKRPHLSVLARRAARWVADNGRALDDADPEMPDALGDREQDNWRPLIAIADAISEELGKRARAAALKLADVKEDDSAAILLLGDVAAIFELRLKPGDKPRLSSDVILADLLRLEDRPWSEWRRGHPMTKVSVARLLKPFGVHPKLFRFKPKPAPGERGYEAGPVLEAKKRYVDNEQKLEEGDVADEPL